VKLCAVLAAAIVVIVGFGEGIPWIIGTFAVLVGLGAVALVAGSTSSAVPVLHGHGSDRRRAENHELRHMKRLRRLGVRAKWRVWKEGNGYAGETKPDPAGWARLSNEEKASVYMAGALSSENPRCYADDLAAVDGLGVSRSKARRLARQ
jgi:hypothetical protein